MCETGVWKRKPTAMPTNVTRISVNVVRATDAIVRAGEDRGTAHRERAEAVGDALRHVLGDADSQRRPAEDGRLHDDPGNQVVGVAPVRRARGSSRRTRTGTAARRSPAASMRRRRSAACAAATAGCGARSRACRRRIPAASSAAVGARAELTRPCALRRIRPARRSLASASAVSSAPRPVSARKTSSSEGRCTPRSSIGMPASSIARAATSRLSTRSTTGMRTRCACASIVTRSGKIGSSSSAMRGRSAALREVHLDHVAADARLELVGGAERDHLAVVDHRDAIGETVGLVEVLGGQKQRRPVVHQLRDEIPQIDARTRVEAGRRLVHQQHPRSPDEARPEVETPPHAARVGAHEALGRVGQAEARQRLGRADLRVLPAQAVQLADHLEVLAAGQRLVDRGELAGEPEQPPRVLRARDDVDAVDARMAPVGNRAASRARGRSSSFRRRSDRADRARCLRGRRGRRPRVRSSRRTPCGAPRPR